MPKIKLLYLFWIMVCILLVLIVPNYRTETTNFYGIAETREILVNSENPVEIKKIHVVPGQEVTQGELLVEFDRPELTLRINEIAHELDELKAQKVINTDGLRSQINELQAQKISKISEINYQLKQLQAQYDLNRELAADLRSIENRNTKGRKQDSINPISIKIESLKKELELAINPIQIRIDMLERELNPPENPVIIRIERLEKELNLLLEEKNKLYIHAQVTGIIGSVNFKEAEKIAPFTPVLTLHTKSPSWVQGFIHEDVYNRISIGDEVEIVSLADNQNRVIGKVIGVGSRIVEFPERLRKNPDILVWGREVQIKIPEANGFLLGEKVLISSFENHKPSSRSISKSIFSLEQTNANELQKTADHQGQDLDIMDIQVTSPLKDRVHIEASGTVYLKDLKKYLVVSDDTDHGEPVLYLMDHEGTVVEAVNIMGLEKIDDMEAVTMDHSGSIYVACSQSHNRKGMPPDERKLLVRVQRDRVMFRLDKKVFLYDLLRDALQNNNQADWAQFMRTGSDELTINIEGIFHHKGCLYLGLKKPLKDHQAVILRINHIDRVFEKNALGEKSIELWKALDLRDKDSGVPAGISDLYLHKDRLFILSFVKIKKDDQKRKSGNLWVYDLTDNKLSWIMHLNHLKPEGITFNPDTKQFLITCDHGKKEPSKILKLRDL